MDITPTRIRRTIPTRFSQIRLPNRPSRPDAPAGAHGRREASLCLTAMAGCVACAGFVAAITPAAARLTQAGAPPTVGAYVDAKSHGKHSWNVNGQHGLLWDGRPYLPVGGTFTPRSLDENTDAAWNQDVAALSTLKAHGINDLILWPTRPLPDISQQAMQRLIDELDAKGFHYGLSFGPGIVQPARGYVIRPTVYRFEDPTGITALWQTTDADAAAYFTVDADKQSAIVRKGMAT